MGRAGFLATLALTWSLAAVTSAQIPDSWKGEVQLDTEIPSFSPVSGAMVMTKSGGVVPIDVSHGMIRGQASIPYSNNIDIPPAPPALKALGTRSCPEPPPPWPRPARQPPPCSI
jgi:hypothetical protein